MPSPCDQLRARRAAPRAHPAGMFPLALAAALVSAGCQPDADPIVPLALPSSFSSSGNAARPDKWWTVWQNRKLDALVERSLSTNFDLEAAWQRLQQAEAVARRERSALFPKVDGALGAEFESGGSGRGRLSGNGDVGVGNQELQLGLTASYEVDLWGEIESRVEAEKFRAEASRFDYETAAITLSAEVVSTWYQLAEGRAQVELLREQIDTNAKVLRLLEARLGEGQGRGVDVLRQKQLLEATREQKVVAEAQTGLLENRLAVLAGQAPRGASFPTGRMLPPLPPLPQTGLPLELIGRRPDVRSAYQKVRAADEDLAAAVSDRFPRLNLTAPLGTSGENPSDLFEDWMRAIAAELVVPAIDGRQRASEVERTRAAQKEALAAYRQSALVAIREVEDSLLQERKQVERVRQLEAQATLARRSSRQLRLEFLNGVGNYIDVLTALDGEQQLERDLLTARRSLVEFRIALHRSLAGGFEVPQPGPAGDTREDEHLP